MDRAAFFSSLRGRSSGVFGTSLSKDQVEGVEAILDAGGHLPLSHLAYALGTAYGETGGRMQPITENMNYSAHRIPQVFSARRLKGYKASQLAGKPELMANVVYSDMLGNGNVASGDGWRYRGHGLVQLTGKDNFRRMGNLVGVDLVAQPARALEMDIAAKALIAGIETGLYTGKKASDYLPGDYVNARRIINGTFEAQKYAGYARAFDAALKAGGYQPGATAKPPEPKAPATPEKTPDGGQVAPPPGGGLLSALIAFLAAIFKTAPTDDKKRGLVPVPFEGRTIWVTPDYYKEDGIRKPVNLPEAVKIAADAGLVLPTAQMVDAIYSAADVKLKPQPLNPTNTGDPKFYQRGGMTDPKWAAFHDAMIENQLNGRKGLIAGHKKDIIRPKQAGKVTIYGWHMTEGNPIQKVNSLHDAGYADYSHGLRLVHDPEGKA